MPVCSASQRFQTVLEILARKQLKNSPVLCVSLDLNLKNTNTYEANTWEICIAVKKIGQIRFGKICT
jgi:hypothetical protein